MNFNKMASDIRKSIRYHNWSRDLSENNTSVSKSSIVAADALAPLDAWESVDRVMIKSDPINLRVPHLKS